MNILFVLHSTSLYGANRSLLNLLDGLDRKKYRPFCFVKGEGPVIKELSERGIESKKIDFQWSSIPLSTSKKKFSKKYLRVIRKYLNNFLLLVYAINYVSHRKIDLIYSNSSVTDFGHFISLFTGKKHIWHLREFGDLDYQISPLYGRALLKFFLRRSFAVVPISKAIEEHFCLADSKRSFVIYNGILKKSEFDYWKTRQSEANESETFTFLLLGQIHPGKGHADALAAISKLIEDGYDIKLVIAGSGFFDPLNKIIMSYNIKKAVDYVGKSDDPLNLIRSSDCLLMCSKNEAWGRVTVEAMAVGTPVIGYNNGGTSEILSHNITGLLYSNIDELVLNMKRLIDDNSLSASLKNEAWSDARESYNQERYCKEIENILSSAKTI